jgi:hypothetical protein
MLLFLRRTACTFLLLVIEVRKAITDFIIHQVQESGASLWLSMTRQNLYGI